MYSSYSQHNYGEVFQAVITTYRPLVAVELGVLEGYSTVHIAKGLQRNARIGLIGHLHSYDLFEDYPYRHGELEQVKSELFLAGVGEFVTLHKGDAYAVHESYAPQSVQFLHVDISNTGDTVRRIMELWDSKLDTGGVICFEGGSEERDQVEWMQKHQMPPMKPAIESNELIRQKYVYGTYLRFPSMTCLLKKRE